MRALFSYGVALLLLILAGAWMATGTLVMGGSGPGNGEKPIVSVIDGKKDGPLATTLADAGVLATPPDAHETTDPHLTIAQRNENEHGANTALQSVRTSTFVAKPYAIDVSLRGRTEAKASIGAVAETSGVIDAVHVTKGQKVATGDLLCKIGRAHV